MPFRCILIFAVLWCATPAVARSRWLKFEATAYSVDGVTASGHATRESRTVAADPDVLPLGSRVEIKRAGSYSGIYQSKARGTKIVGRKIDIFIEDPVEAKRFGVKQVRLRVLKTATSAAKADQ